MTPNESNTTAEDLVQAICDGVKDISVFNDGRVVLELSLIHISEPTRPY